MAPRCFHVRQAKAWLRCTTPCSALVAIIKARHWERRALSSFPGDNDLAPQTKQCKNGFDDAHLASTQTSASDPNDKGLYSGLTPPRTVTFQWPSFM